MHLFAIEEAFGTLLLMGVGSVLCRCLTAETGRLPQVTVKREEKKTEVLLPGYSYADLDRMGEIFCCFCCFLVF